MDKALGVFGLHSLLIRQDVATPVITEDDIIQAIAWQIVATLLKDGNFSKFYASVIAKTIPMGNS